MPTFDYKAKDRNGNTVAGTLDATDDRAAAGMIREMGYLPMDIRGARSSVQTAQSREAGSAFARYLIYPLWTGVNIKQLAFFYRQLATLLASGMSLSEALRSVGSRMGGRLRAIIDEAHDSGQGGGQLSATMSRYPRVFSPLQISLVRAGEHGGLIEGMVDRIASYLEYELKVRRLISKMTIYPIVVLVFAVIMHICVPHLPALVKQGANVFFPLVWPGLRMWLLIFLVTLVVLKLLFQFRAVRLMWDFAKIQPPVAGSAARKIAMSRFCKALAVLYSAGMSFAEAVPIAADACGNLALAGGMKYAVPALQAGRGITDSLGQTRMLMPMVLDMMSTGERTGNMDASLEKVAEYMDDEVDVTIHKLGIILFVAMILVAAVVVGSIVIDFYRKYYGSLLGGA